MSILAPQRVLHCYNHLGQSNKPDGAQEAEMGAAQNRLEHAIDYLAMPAQHSRF